MGSQPEYYDECLTNERLFKVNSGSQFDIVNRAITVAEYQIRSGREGHEMDIGNVAYTTLEELANSGI